MFIRDESRRGHPVSDVVKDECRWVQDGEGTATVKLDGTNVAVWSGRLYKRRKPKDRDYDMASYVPCEASDPADKWAFEAFEHWIDDVTGTPGPPDDGIYELIGPKVQGNKHGVQGGHVMVKVVPPAGKLVVRVADRSFDGLRAWLRDHPKAEGLVFHHSDGRMAKIKRRDYGLSW